MGFFPLGIIAVVIAFGRIASNATGLGAEVSFLGFLDSLLDFC
jgi:hypothetical protein